MRTAETAPLQQLAVVAKVAQEHPLLVDCSSCLQLRCYFAAAAAHSTLNRTPCFARETPNRFGPWILLHGPFQFVRPAWALSSGCKSHRKEAILIEVKRNYGRATNRGEEARSETVGRCIRTGFEALPRGASEQMIAKLRWPSLRRCRSGGRAVKDSAITWGYLASDLKGSRCHVHRSEKSAEAIVGRVGRRC